MKMVLRWFPYGDDSVTLNQIKQVPLVSGVATCLPKVPVGETWTLSEVEKLRKTVNAEGLEMEVIESVNVHEDIKKGLDTRDQYIQNYIETIKNLSKAGVRCLCYNLMPVMDWIRSDLSYENADKSQVMIYRHSEVLKMNPSKINDEMKSKSDGYSLPGWEPERIEAMSADIKYYSELSKQQYWDNMKYFLDSVLPYAKECDIKMAIHPDDPPWPLFSLPKMIANADGIRKLISLNENEYNGITLCTGSLGANPENNMLEIAKEFAGKNRIFFAHIRNIKKLNDHDFDECAHPSECGELDVFEIVKALADNGFDGYIRPDHGRMIWGEKARPGYGLYDRAMGATYLLGLWEAVKKQNS